MDLKVEHDKKYQQFTIAMGDEDAELAYATPLTNVLDFTHTYVPVSARGKGVASKLITEGLKYAEENDYKIIATCPTVKIFIQRHSEFEKIIYEQ